jgi:hypothetical protein
MYLSIKSVSFIFLLLIISGFSLLAQTDGNLNDFWKPGQGKRQSFSSYDTSGFNIDAVAIASGKTHTLCDLKKASGIIQRIWATIQTSDTFYLQEVKIKMTFDDEITVDNVPLGMFTGTGPWRVNDLVTPVLNVMRSRKLNQDQAGTGAGSFNIHFPMPFTKNVKIEVQNNTSGDIDFFYFIDYTELPFNDKPLLFHANYNIQSPTKASNNGKDLNTSGNYELSDQITKPWNEVKHQSVAGNYELLKVNGYQGKYVGTILCVESHPDRKGKWYEGDDMFVIDDEPWPPRLHGTGTEDYFGMAWGFHRIYQAFDHGISHFEKNITDHDRFFDGCYVVYRFHINDPVLFYKSIHASIEAGHANECEQHYESVAIWYGKKNL